MTTNCGRMNICLVPIVFFSVLNYNVVIGSPKPDNDVHFHINMADTKSIPDRNQERDVEHGKDYSSGQDCLMKNTALYGHNIWPQWFKEKETIGDCQMACMYRKIECKFWSYNKQDKRCAIKTSKGNAREGNDDLWESGSRDCVPRPSKSSGPEHEPEPTTLEIQVITETTPKPTLGWESSGKFLG